MGYFTMGFCSAIAWVAVVAISWMVRKSLSAPLDMG